MAHVHFVDEIVKEYLLYRGFSGSLKAFENELKIDKEKGFRIDRVVDGLIQCVYNFDLQTLRDSWSQLESRLFGKLDQHFSIAIRKLENSVLKLYVVHASEKGNTDKVNEFFIKMAQELSSQPDWKDWFTLPFIRNPEDNPTFAVHFTRTWQESLLVSLHNFLAAVYQNLPQPTLTAFEDAATKVTTLQRENEMLRRGIANLLPNPDPDKSAEGLDDLADIMDDFYNITQEIKTAETHAKTIKSFIKIGSGPIVSPLSSSSSSRTHKKVVTKQPTTKRSSSIDARPVAGRSRDRDSSLDPTTIRLKVEHVKVDKQNPPTEGSFLFLSQDEYNDHNTEIIGLKLNEQGNLVASLDIDGNLRIWSTPPSCKTRAVFFSWPQARLVEWVINYERYLLCTDLNEKIRLLDIKKVERVWEMVIPNEGEACLENIVSSPVELSAMVQVSGKVFFLDLKLKKLEKLVDVPGYVTCCAFSPNGHFLVYGCKDGSVGVLDIKKNEVLETLPSLTSSILQIQITVDNNYCCYLSEDKQFRWVPFQGKEEDNRTSHTFTFPGEVTPTSQKNASFLLDLAGSFLLSYGSNSGVIFKFSESGIRKCLELGGHKTPVKCLDWCFANQCVICVTASSDGKIRISTLLIDTLVNHY